jgi:hypothetical protein
MVAVACPVCGRESEFHSDGQGEYLACEHVRSAERELDEIGRAMARMERESEQAMEEAAEGLPFGGSE